MIEFRATIKNGTIEIPVKYRGKIKDRVRVILVPEGKQQKTRNLIDHLLANPVRVKDFRPIKRDAVYQR